MNEVIQVSTTVGTREAAEVIARKLVENRLAACVQISGPISSTFRWQGKIETSEEWVCAAKTLRSKYPRIEAAIRELHSYDEPEIIAVTVAAGSEGYLRWVWKEVADTP